MRLLFISAILIFQITNLVAQNLIANPSCEALLSSPNCGIPSWTCFTGTTWQQRQTGPLPQAGLNYFFAGSNVAGNTAELRQMVNLTSYSTNIDLGGMMFSFSGYISSFNQAPPDESRIVLDYMDVTQTIVLSQYNSGFIANVGSWLLLTNNTVVPAGTRYCRVRLTSRRNSGVNNDGYFDDLSLTPVVVLPIELLYFKGSCTKDGYELRWETASERDADNYVIERSSNAISWKEIGTIKAAGTSLVKRNYSFLDQSNSGEEIYYRLKQKDFDGKESTFNIITIEDQNCGNVSDFVVYPNPAFESIFFRKVKGKIRINDMTGRTILEKTILNGEEAIDIKYFEKGMYLIISEETGEVHKLIKG